jgi:hypothetical protein
MLDDLCSNYNLRNTSAEDLTELAYILFECMKAQIVHNDLLKLTSKWKDLSYVQLFRYLASSANQNRPQNFFITSQLVRSLTQFDAFFEAKLITHLLLEGTNEHIKRSEDDGRTNLNCIVLQKYADAVYSLPGQTGSNNHPNDFLFHPNALISTKSLVSSVIDKVISHCQFKYLNWFLLQLADLMPSYAIDNEQYLQVFLQFAVPATQSKMVSQIRLHNIRLFDFGLANALRNIPKTFVA